MSKPILEVENLSIRYRTRDESIRAVSDCSFRIDQDEYFGLVGESGCGKSTVASSIVGGLDANGEIASGKIKYKGREIQNFTEKEYDQEIRWKEIAVIPQAAMNSLDPLSRLSEQAREVARKHTTWSDDETLDRLRELFDVVGLPQERIHDYPFQFSGGMKQRAIIALSLLLEPSLLIADEPTTALDVIMQDKVLNHLNEIREDRDLGMLLITHDISVVFETCDSMGIMHAGQLAESGTTTSIFDRPRHPYTILLKQAFPDIRNPYAELTTIEGSPPALRDSVDFCTFADRCPWAEEACIADAPSASFIDQENDHKVACVRVDEMERLASDYLNSEETRQNTQRGRRELQSNRKDYVLQLNNVEKHFSQSTNILDTVRNSLFGNEEEPIRAVDSVDFRLGENEVQGLIGESGCGKSTLLRTLMGAYEPTNGDIMFDGKSISEFSKADWKEYRRRIQIILQDPFNTLNPRFTVEEAVNEPRHIHGLERDRERILDVLEEVQLTPPERYIDRTEANLSGGEKQRVSIARALVLEPDIILADEPVSMLDVSTQASILKLLARLSREHDVSMIYVSHDLSTVSYVCDVVNVMYLGRIVERAPTEEILTNPKHPYTKALTDSIPIPDPYHERSLAQLPDTASDAGNMPSGCRFKDRCPDRMDICDRSPKFLEANENSDHEVACHLYHDQEEMEVTDQVEVTGQ